MVIFELFLKSDAKLSMELKNRVNGGEDDH